jgi:heme exporter protein B
VPSQTAATIFWLASLFSLVLMSNALFSLEEEANARHALLLSPAPLASVWAGKAVASILLLAASQLAFFPATVIFLGNEPSGSASTWLVGIAGILVVDWGLVAVGTLLGALAQGQAGRESLLSLVLFPLVVPVLLAGIRLTTGFLEGVSPVGAGAWLGLALGFGALYSSVGLLLFPVLYRAGD